MGLYNYNTANLGNLLLVLLFILFFNESCAIIDKIKVKRETKDDPISALVKQKQRQQDGVNFTEKELKKIERINKKYSLSDKQKAYRKQLPGGYKVENDLIRQTQRNNGYAAIIKKNKTKPISIKRRKKIGLGGKFVLMRSYRKDYLREKKLNELKRKKLLSIQFPKTRERMEKRQKELKRREKERKINIRRKKFKNLFK